MVSGSCGLWIAIHGDAIWELGLGTRWYDCVSVRVDGTRENVMLFDFHLFGYKM